MIIYDYSTNILLVFLEHKMLDLIIYAIVGGLIGVLIIFLSDILVQTHLPEKEQLPYFRKFSRPVCPHCHKPYSLRAYLISFKCQNCGEKPSAKSYIVLISSIIYAVLVGIFPLGGLSFWLTVPIMVFLGIILVIDIEYHAVLIETSIFGLIFFALYGYILQIPILNTFQERALYTGAGGVAGFLIMLLIYFFGIFFSKTMGKLRKGEPSEPGMGFGDVYVCAFLGFFTGWPQVIGMIVFGIILSGLYSFIYLIVKSIKKEYQVAATIPYAPFLIVGAIILFYLPRIPSL
jgi:prepilin signal peptidase PulO-like enzyme (type II secretory pathway)